MQKICLEIEKKGRKKRKKRENNKYTNKAANFLFLFF